jgi:AraC-like DNA-binding protein
MKKHSALLHLIPPLFSYVSLIPFFPLTEEKKVDVYLSIGEGFKILLLINLILLYLSGAGYLIWTHILLRKHKKNIRNQFSDIKNIKLRWLQFLTFGLGVVWSVIIFTQNTYCIFVAITFIIILIGFFCVQQIDVFGYKKPTVRVIDKQTFEGTIKKEKYAKSGLTKTLAEDVYSKLLYLLNKECYYKKNNLLLNDLASVLDIHPNYLSQIINEKRGESFYDFINSYRIEEFIRLIKNPENHQFTLIALAFDSGFNSKSSFNRYFKKRTGITPSQYFKSIKSLYVTVNS